MEVQARWRLLGCAPPPAAAPASGAAVGLQTSFVDADLLQAEETPDLVLLHFVVAVYTDPTSQASKGVSLSANAHIVFLLYG